MHGPKLRISYYLPFLVAGPLYPPNRGGRPNDSSVSYSRSLSFSDCDSNALVCKSLCISVDNFLKLDHTNCQH